MDIKVLFKIARGEYYKRLKMRKSIWAIEMSNASFPYSCAQIFN